MAKTNGRADGLRAAKEFFGKIIRNPEYLKNLETRMIAGDLQPSAEMRAWEYYFGKPVEQITLSRETEDLDHLTTDELIALTMELQQQIRELKDEDDTTPTFPVAEPSTVQ